MPRRTPPQLTEPRDELPRLYFMLSALIHAVKDLNAAEKNTITHALHRNAQTATPDQAKRLRGMADVISEHSQIMVDR